MKVHPQARMIKGRLMDKLRFTGKALDEGLFDLYSRKRVLSFILVVSLLTFLPLIIKNYLVGESLLASFLLAFELSLMIEIYGVLRLKHKIIGYQSPLFLLVICIVLSVHIFGTLATYWVFPIVTAIVLLVPKRMAIGVNSVIIIATTIAALPHQPVMVTLRFSLALMICTAITQCVIEAVRKLQGNLSYLSTRDSLTGAFNRHQMEISLQVASQRTLAGAGTCIAVIDIDYFKAVNDQHGHDVGDKVIKSVVELVNVNSRQTDLLFRLGGDEFLLLFDNTQLEHALNITQNIRQQVVIGLAEKCPNIQQVTLSIGLAESIENEDSEYWVKRADTALYMAKQAGRDQIKVSDPAEFYANKVVRL